MSQSRLTSEALLQAVATNADETGLSSTRLAHLTGGSLPTVKRMLQRLVLEGRLLVIGQARATRYALPAPARELRHAQSLAVQLPPDQGYVPIAASNMADRPNTLRLSIAEPPSSYEARFAPAQRVTAMSKPAGEKGLSEIPQHSAGAEAASASPVAWSPESLALRAWLSTPPASRPPVTYRREWVDDYQPNISSLLPHSLAHELWELGRLDEQLPAGTYIRKVLEQLLIDLSWSSSHLEGNRYSLLDTERLFKSGSAATDSDSVMLLNHKAAIEFLVDTVPLYGLNVGIIRNLHAVLMQDLLNDADSLGAVREKVVGIHSTAYIPTQVPALLHEMLDSIVEKAQRIRNPVEAAFFLWVHLAYLQAFEDGNKRVSRLAANIPLMLSNHSPLSFLNVSRSDYALAMMGFYKCGNLSMAIDLFAWTYRQSHARYHVVLQATGRPDAFRVRNREVLNALMALVVRQRLPVDRALEKLNVPADDLPRLRQIFEQELKSLMPHNCARYRLGMAETQAWVDAGRPGADQT